MSSSNKIETYVIPMAGGNNGDTTTTTIEIVQSDMSDLKGRIDPSTS